MKKIIIILLSWICYVSSVPVFALEQFSEEINLTERNKIELEDISTSKPTRKGYTVTAKIKSDIPITKVLMPTWTEANWQDDIRWYEAEVKDNGDGTYTASADIDIKNHNRESGKYITHVYADDELHNENSWSAGTIEVPENKAPVISDVKIDKSTSGYTISCKVEDDGEITGVEIPTWTDKDWQDDIIWYPAEKQGNRYVVNVKIADHNYEYGLYHSHIYAYDNDGVSTACGEEINLTERNKIELEDISTSKPTRKGYTVTAKIKSDIPITKVLMPTWTEANWQDDIRWYEAEVKDNGDGTYTASADIDIKNHNRESGKYITHVYADDELHNENSWSAGTIEVPENKAPVISDVKIDKSTSGYTISCKVEDDGEITGVEIPTWTEKNGQDDLIWYTAQKSGDRYYVDVNMLDHYYGYGPYISHIYATDDDGARVSTAEAGAIYIPKPDLGGRPIIENVYVTDVTNTGYTVACDVDSSSTITKVLMPTWTVRNGQDDIIWHLATRNGNTFSYRVSRSEHNYEYGSYITHIYAYNEIGTNTFCLDTQEISSGYVNPGWSYINGQKYFSDKTGTIVGNMPSKKVIDVSSYNGTIDWGRVAREGDVDGVIIRIAQHPNGSYIEDTQFANNLFGCINNNIPIGVYIYDYSHSTIDANNEADLVLSILRKYGVSPSQLQYGVYFDMERDQSQTGLSTLQMKDVALTFLTRVASNGYPAAIYSYRSLLNGYLNHPDIWSHTSWMAAYTKTIGWSNPYFHGPFGWQYTSGGTIPGINGYVDISCWYNV